ncbi:MAG: GNAT family N-acetyltransferase [Myxococcales bacterium]|nr:GNAT family N-acetyltransferase [Myxococcales bacterium]
MIARPPFASVALAARIEAAERDLIAEAVASSRARDPGEGAAVWPLAGGVAAWAGAGSPLNKDAGLGFAGPPDEDALAAIERAFAARGAALQVELATLADPAIAPLLSGRGYLLGGFENVLGRRLDPHEAPPTPPAIDVRESAADELDAWVDVVVDGFATPDTEGVPSHESFPREIIARVIRDQSGGASFARFTARLDGAIAGGASMRIAARQRIAQLCGAATLPALRRRGVQSALLNARLRAAAAAGCELAVITTLPGSRSQENAERQGFALLYSRAILVRAP